MGSKLAGEKKILIKGGTTVVGPTVCQQDVLIEGERISALGDFSVRTADVVIDASGLLVLPGAVDTHVHFNDSFMSTTSVHDYYAGTLAAAFGGVTAVVDFSNQTATGSLLDTLERKRKEAEGLALVDWGVHPVITRPSPENLDEIPILIERGAPTIKGYMTYRKEGLMVGLDGLKKVLKKLSESNGMLMVHAEDNKTIEKNVPSFIGAGLTKPIYHARSRPPDTENIAIQSCIRMARETNGRLFIVHMATAEGVELVRAARAEGLDVFAETCTHYLVFTEDMLEREDGIKWICSPPLRSREVQDCLWAALQEGLISMVTSDDAAYSWAAKRLGAGRFDKCPNGIPGIEVRLSLLYSEGVAKGRLSLARFVELVASAPAYFFGLAPRKGSLAPGADADIVLFDPAEKWIMGRPTLHMAADWSAYEDIEITGRIKKVFSRGDLIIDEGRCVAEKGRGRYIFRSLPPRNLK